MAENNTFITWGDLRGYAISIAMASAILFGYGHHPTIDAIIATFVWVFLIFAAVVMLGLSGSLIAIRRHEKRNDPDLGKFYKALSAMHKKGIIKRLLGFGLIGYWLYALVVQEWTATAVFYVILTMYVQLFIFLTRDIAKDFFVNQLKGEGVAE